MGKYKIELKKSAAKEIAKLPKQALRAIMERITALTDNPRPIDCKKLSGEEKYRIRCGRYRILYLIEDEVLLIFVVKVAHRKDVYR
jgi:mRNA interferase RelE/StbE